MRELVHVAIAQLERRARPRAACHQTNILYMVDDIFAADISKTHRKHDKVQMRIEV